MPFLQNRNTTVQTAHAAGCRQIEKKIKQVKIIFYIFDVGYNKNDSTRCYKKKDWRPCEFYFVMFSAIISGVSWMAIDPDYILEECNNILGNFFYKKELYENIRLWMSKS